MKSTIFAIKAEVSHRRAKSFTFNEQKTMYGCRHIAKGDLIFIFASENEGGPGLIANGTVTSAVAIPKKPGIVRNTPRVSITIRRTGLAKHRLGRCELKPFCNWNDSRPETELNFKFYRQATNKIVGISDDAAEFYADSFSCHIADHYDVSVMKRSDLIEVLVERIVGVACPHPVRVAIDGVAMFKRLLQKSIEVAKESVP